MRLAARTLLAGICIGTLGTAVRAQSVQVVSSQSMGRMPLSGTEDFRLVTNKDLSKVAVMDRWGDEHHWYLAMNSLVWEFYVETDAPSAQFSADGKHLSLLAKHDDQWFLITDDKDVHALGAGACRGLALSADGKHDACIQKVEGGEQVLLDGKAATVQGVKMPVDEVAGVAFDGAGRLVYSARAQGKAVIVEGAQLLGSVPADRVLAPVVSGDGHVLCGASKQDGTGTRIMRLVDGAVAGTPYLTPLAGTEVKVLVQSGNGEHLAWGKADTNGKRAMVDGQEKGWTTGEVAQVVVGPDGKHWAWIDEAAGGS